MPNRMMRTQSNNAAGAAPVPGMAGATDAAQQAALQRSPEEAAALYMANRERNKDLTAAGFLPRLPTHPFVSGQDDQTATPTPAPQGTRLPFAPGIRPPTP